MAWPDDLSRRLLVLEREPLGPRTTLGVGGPARRVVEPRSREELILAARRLRETGTPFCVLGGGSNLLVADEGVDETVVHTRQVSGIWHDGERPHALRVAAGTSLPRLISVAQRQGLSGLEPLMGIPGTVGGAVAGNSGGRHGWTGDRLVAVTVLDEDGGPREVPCAPDDFGYRVSPFAARLVVDAVFALEPAPPAVVLARMQEVLDAKRASQPLAARSAGCFFLNRGRQPVARLIDEAGCKGLREGAARVSERHANFLLNAGGARAADFGRLVAEVRARVAARGGPWLELEIECWGGVDS